MTVAWNSGMSATAQNGSYVVPTDIAPPAQEHTNTTDALEDPNVAFYNSAEYINGLILFPVICCVGIFGNFCIIVVLSKSKEKTSTNIFLIALAISDLIKLLNDSLYFLVVLLNQVNPKIGHEVRINLYPYSHYVLTTSICTTAWLTVSVAVERYIFVCHPVKAKAICSNKRSIITSFLVSAAMVIISIPSALRYHKVPVYKNNNTQFDIDRTSLWQDKTFGVAYTWVQNLLRAVIPLLVLTVLNILIIRALWKTRANKKCQSRNKITMMLISIIAVFLICITPDAVLSTVFGFGYYESNYLVRGIREYSDMLVAVNSAVNVFLYAVFNKMFRLNFKIIFCGHYYRNRLQSEVSRFERLQLSTNRSNGKRSLSSSKLQCQEPLNGHASSTKVYKNISSLV